MPAPSSGVYKKVTFKVEAAYGTVPAAAGPVGQSLRRVTSSLDLSKDTYQSEEIRDDLQMSDFRHGARRVQGNINGELSAKTYSEFFGAILKRDFAAGNSVALAATTLAIAGAGPTYTLTRSAGDWQTSFKIGEVVRITVGAGLTASNLNKNLLIVGMTATILTVIVLNASGMVTDAATATCTVASTGKKTWVPSTAHTDRSYSIEHWFSDNSFSEVFSGCKPASCAIDLPPTGMATVNWEFRGQNVTTAGAQYFTTPTANTTTGIMAAVNGVVRVAGVTVAVLTGLQITINANFTGDPVVGSNTIPNQFPGRVIVSGQASAYFDTTTFRDAFLNETEVEIIAVFTASNAAAADFITFVMPRVKLGGASKDDGEKGIVQTLPFQALLGTAANYEATTLMMQDSAA